MLLQLRIFQMGPASYAVFGRKEQTQTQLKKSLFLVENKWRDRFPLTLLEGATLPFSANA